MLQIFIGDTFNKNVPRMMKYIHYSVSVLAEREKIQRKKEETNENTTNDRVPARGFCLWSQSYTKEMRCICVESKSICLVCMLLVCVCK